MSDDRRVVMILAGLLAMTPAQALAQGEQPAVDAGELEDAEGGMTDDELLEDELLEDDELLDEDPGEGDEGGVKIDAVEVEFSPDAIARDSGSVTTLDEDALEAFEYDDPEKILQQVPGVYVRSEDGFGLRPNIGLRGASSERSKKVTLMEDGILFGPAPYAAPAAYYFPLMTRMTDVEVFKGPSAILFGPQTIGGAVNLRTRTIPAYGHVWGVDAAAGSLPSGKLHAYYGWGGETFGVLAEAVHLESAGFKEIDGVEGGGDTGFSKTEGMLKARLNTSGEGEVFQLVEVKLGGAREVSNETYLGLTDADLRATPNRRYVASALDRMEWWRTQAELRYELEVGDWLDVSAVAYRNDMSRAWLKFNRFSDGTDAADVLAAPDTARNQVYFETLTGQVDNDPATRMGIGTNARRFVSQGVQAQARVLGAIGGLENKLEVGARLHADHIERDHDQRDYDVVGGQLQEAGDLEVTADNRGEATALALHVVDQLDVWRFTFTPGFRAEIIGTGFEDRLAGTSSQANQVALLPGFGALMELPGGFELVGGVHRGFSPVGPGQPEEVDPEYAINSEFGARYARAASQTQVEAIGFTSAYSNVTGQCAFSSGCAPEDLDRQFNGGEAFIWGVEAVAAHTLEAPGGLSFPLRATYTFTDARFQSAFRSTNPQFGDVEVGDALPYVPTHQASGQFGLRWSGGVSLNVGATYVDRMREEASQGEDGTFTDAYTMLDALVGWSPVETVQIYVRGDNLLDAAPIVSRRPYGARSIRPRFGQLGVKWTVD
jgi:Fe(3+) dicitrate transport protein